ncbi:muscarinic acetylcholine receptor M3-like [Strongylocentrotus purpuratus]|uniref:G-protein coupled receptors family 1 profile domain-containing protein n=1 Tax=Strongylocentrotus purpuratus TaxID=7668 RepID=A0A7M7T079_STRPU|nr:muscarinic acetylcholine receptor M3-like [Strongylocentrotus purpuratus]
MQKKKKKKKKKKIEEADTGSVILIGIIAVTVIGNVFVVVAFFRDARIRSTAANFFILNLAITDLSVGTVVMTMNLADIIKDHWPFGETFCKLWSTFEFTLTLMSTITMLLISWDRYCLLTMGIGYKTYQTQKRIGAVLSFFWMACLVFYGTLAFGWKGLFGKGKSTIDYSTQCEMEFLTNVNATVVVNVIEFVIPFTLLLILNVLVYIRIRRRSVGVIGDSQNNRQTVKPRNSDITIPVCVPETEGNRSVREGVKICFSISTIAVSPKHSSSKEPYGDNGGHHEDTSARHVLKDSKSRLFRSMQSSVINGNVGVRTSSLHQPVVGKDQTNGRSAATKTKGALSKHRKAALVLTILSCCYFLCYTPYNICSIVYAICKFECENKLVWEVTSYLLWCNSAINPFIYAATNVHFRRNFRRFLFLDRWSCDVNTCKVKGHRGNPDTPLIAETEHETRQ